MKNIPQIITSFLDTDLYKFSMGCCIHENFSGAMAQYHFVDRNNTVYPKGFAEELCKQIVYLENVTATDSDIKFLEDKCYYMPTTYIHDFLKNFKFNRNWVEVSQDNEGHLDIWFGRKEGYWYQTVLLEVTVMAIIARLYYIMTNQDEKFDYEEYYRKSYAKAISMLSNGLTVSDFGTRRRFSLDAEDAVVRAFVDADKYLKYTMGNNYKGKFAGTSNVYLAKKYNITPIGTMAHEFISAMAGMYGPVEANSIAMKYWNKTYKGNLGVYLYDTYTFDVFASNFTVENANAFVGLRVDSGDNIEQMEKIMAKYRELGVDPSTKQIIFSNALDTERAIQLHKDVNGRMKDSYGIGTHLTNDIEGVKPMNMVIKLVGIKQSKNRKWQKTCKMSEDKGKVTGDEDIINAFKVILFG